MLIRNKLVFSLKYYYKTPPTDFYPWEGFYSHYSISAYRLANTLCKHSGSTRSQCLCGFAFICILRAYYQRSPFRFYTILHRFRLSVNMQMNRIRFCLRMPHNTSVFRCRLCSNHNTVPMIRLALK